MFENINSCNQLIQERQVIQENIKQISSLSEEFTNLAELQYDSSDLSSYQISFLNEKRINLRNHISDLKDGLQIHYDLGENVLRPLISLSLLQLLIEKHRLVIGKLAEIEGVILNLSPLGVLFNSTYIRQQIGAISQAMHYLSSQESSLLAFSGICRNEEPV